MSRKIILLNLALLALAGTLVWQARKHYREMKAHEREVLQRSIRPVPALPPPSIPAPQPVAPVQYIDVAQKTLFTRDRNPNVVIEVPPPKPEPPMPALPVYFGRMDFGDPVVILSIRGGAQKRFHAGEKVGDFDLVSFDSDKIIFGWNNKQVEKKFDELKPKSSQPQAEALPATTGQPSWMGKPLPTFQAPGSQPAAGTNTSGPQIKSVSDSSTDDVKPNSPIGQSIGGTDFRACSMTDPTPDGQVVDGFRKVIRTTLMGKSCYWEKVK
jgi:hypothetical protein